MNREDKKKDVEKLFSDTITEMPIPFECGGKYFNLYQKSLGKLILMNRLRSHLNFSEENIKTNPALEVKRLCEEQTDVVLRMIAYSTKKTPRAIFDEKDNAKLIELFRENMNVSDMASLLMYILQDETETINILKKHFRIDKEQDRRAAIAKVKGKSNSISIGGQSTFGTLIDFFCQRYGWEKEYVIWGISYINLMMLYYDHPDSIFLSDEEMKKLPAHVRAGGQSIDPTTPEGREMIKNMNWK